MTISYGRINTMFQFMTKVQMYLEASIIVTTLPFLVAAVSLPSLIRDNVANKRKIDPKATQYLLKFGHLDRKYDARYVLDSQEPQPTMAEAFAVHTDDEISNGIKSLRKMLGLEVSGNLNDETVRLTNTPRNVMSNNKVHNRSKRYVIKPGQKFFKKSLTWRIEQFYTGSITRQKQQEIFNKAFTFWEFHSSLRFTRSSSYGDIHIYFYKGNHGDQFPFTSTLKLAHTALPGRNSYKQGDMHFNDDVVWTEQYLYDCAVHEIGHVVGLSHSRVFFSIMFDYSPRTFLTMPNDDQLGINKLYGECQTTVDAVLQKKNHDILFIRKDLIWKWDYLGNRVYTGYPKKLNDEFPISSGPAIPSDLDCATWRFRYPVTPLMDELFVFVKGDKVWIYDVERKTTSVKTIAQFYQSGKGKFAALDGGQPVPNNIDACMSFHTPLETWIFKGNLGWQHNDRDEYNVKGNNPGLITGLSSGYDDGFVENIPKQEIKHIYMFKGNQYWVHTLKYGYLLFVSPKEKRPVFTPGGFIHKKWPGICSAKY